MRKFSFSSLRVRLIILVLLAIIPALGLTLYTGLEQRQIATNQAKDEALRLAHFASSRQRQLIEGVHQFLDTLARLPQVRRFDPTICSRLFADILKQYPHYLNIGAIGLDGYIFASAIPPPKQINVADRPYFQRALKTKKFTVGEYQIGRITGKPGVNLGYPVMDDIGTVKAVVYVVLDLTWLNQLTLQADLPQDSILSLIDSDSTILARYPEPEKWVGKTMPEASVVETILAKGEGMIETIGADGVQRLYAFTSFGSTVSQADKVYVSIGIPSSAIFAQVERTLIRNLAFLLFISLLALSAAWFGGDLLVLRRLNPIVSATKRLGAGDLSARTGIVYGKGELSQLASAFDEMAESLEKYEAERKRAGEALRESEERYRSFFANSIDGVILTSPDGKILTANPAACRIFGRTEEELCQVGRNGIVDLSDPRLPKALEERERTGKFKGELTLIRKDGTKFPSEISSALFKDKKGFVRTSMIIRDITEHKQAEEALRKNEEVFRELYDNAPVGYFEYDAQGRIASVNRTELEMLGYTAEEMIGHPLWEFVVGEETVRQQISGKLAGTILPARGLERTYKRKDGTILPVLVEDRLLRDGNGKITGLRSTIQDITERKRAEEEKSALQEQLRQSQKIEAIGGLAGGIAHDFNNLLTVISGNCQLSLLELKEDVPLKGNIEEIKRASERATDLTRQLLAFSRRQIMEMKVLDLNDLLKNLDKMLRRVIGEDIELVTLLAEDLGRVKADPGQAEQVIMNLSVNARDAMSDGGKLTIETANVDLDDAYARNHVAVTPGRFVMISVSDTGVGMTPEVRDRVFEPFFTTKEKGKGTGLGLSTVYGIVKQSGGNIWVYSEPGKGTTFKIYLPRVDEPLKKLRERAEGKEIPRGKETVLIVEDEEEVRKLAVRILERQGYKVFEASQGLDAFLIAEGYEDLIHLLVTDVVMPKIGGRELADRIAEICPEIKVLYMSGYTDNAIVHHGVLGEGMEFIQKPFTVEGLARKVRKVLDKDLKPVV